MDTVELMVTQASHVVVLFDGECNLCNGSVQFLIDHDRGDTLRFASLQSEVGKALLQEQGLGGMPISTMVVIEAGRAFVRSTAVLHAARYLRAPWSWGRWLLVVPSWLRDSVYGMVARTRYRVFGKTIACRVPTVALRSRFLDA